MLAARSIMRMLPPWSVVDEAAGGGGGDSIDMAVAECWAVVDDVSQDDGGHDAW